MTGSRGADSESGSADCPHTGCAALPQRGVTLQYTAIQSCTKAVQKPPLRLPRRLFPSSLARFAIWRAYGQLPDLGATPHLGGAETCLFLEPLPTEKNEKLFVSPAKSRRFLRGQGVTSASPLYASPADIQGCRPPTPENLHPRGGRLTSYLACHARIP